MSILGWLLLGLIAGAIARAILPGDQKGGCLVTLITGVFGALVGGWIASAIFGVNVNDSFFDLGTWIFAILGGLIVAFIWQAITRNRGRAE
ncbi:GlsB/YeaQ/YmgE family stress response membrane protein [Nesterenkonia alkaliphila]|uniref:GlsB/YeaQ/YmgE family stress response membrane protein n=1 Tax=Nesterenkonia alkaliphila TaxID=1463631 RepID=A0A7K1UHM8_9MICC|nr:GlsB/YeaQ/YmgE family stress response membrane protein [Nesterenkonia alkaliphila]MVT25977.1 GlsB/YeaQ/YmgE family stress response membrane protein [Nesterenkonia alkaliphila]GFZ95582.1 membrane protein [Nesterenkonia alkaliphila]